MKKRRKEMGQHTQRALIFWSGALSLHVLLVWVCLYSRETIEKREMPKNIFQVQLLSPKIVPSLNVQPDDISTLNGAGESAIDTQKSSDIGTKPKIVSPEKIYASEEELERRPYPLVPVIVPYPDTVPGKHKGSVTLHLFIDVNGRVERGEVVRSDLLPDFGRSALDAFQKARMSPGIKNGSPTKTKFVVWVEFDSEQQ